MCAARPHATIIVDIVEVEKVVKETVQVKKVVEKVVEKAVTTTPAPKEAVKLRFHARGKSDAIVALGNYVEAFTKDKLFYHSGWGR